MVRSKCIHLGKGYYTWNIVKKIIVLGDMLNFTNNALKFEGEGKNIKIGHCFFFPESY